MRWEIIGIGLAVAAIGLTLMLAVPPPWWPKMPSQLVTASVLAGLALLVVGIGIIATGVFPSLPTYRTGPLFLMVIGVGFFIAGFVWLRFQKPPPPKMGPETENHGWLIPANDPTPQTTCSPNQTNGSGYIFVNVASGGVSSIAKNKITVLTIGDHPTILMEREPSGILVDVDMLAANGNLAVRIEQNEWRTIGNEIAYGKRPDSSTLVVYDKTGKEMFWFRYLNQNTVKFRGIFYKAGNSTPIIIGNDAISLYHPLGLHMPFVNGPITFVPCIVVNGDEFHGSLLTIK